jgi:hypothetical protein
MEHGFVPYRDIPDIIMPGTYIIEGWAMRLFGGSDLAWRIYDLTQRASSWRSTERPPIARENGLMLIRGLYVKHSQRPFSITRIAHPRGIE